MRRRILEIVMLVSLVGLLARWMTAADNLAPPPITSPSPTAVSSGSLAQVFGATLGFGPKTGSHVIAVQLLEHNVDSKVVGQTVEVLQKRLNPDGTRDVVVDPIPPDRLLIKIPDTLNLQEAEALVTTVGRLEFREQSFDPTSKRTDWKTVLDGSMITRALAVPASSGGEWEVTFELDRQGAILFGSITRRLVGRPLGIFFDGQQISSPIVEAPITNGRGVLTGMEGHLDKVTQQTVTAAEQASRLAILLNSGALPVKTRILDAPHPTTRQ